MRVPAAADVFARMLPMPLVAALPAPSPAVAQADFYKGRAIDLVISTGVGGGLDANARVVARHLANHVPGNRPSFRATCRAPAAPGPRHHRAPGRMLAPFPVLGLLRQPQQQDRNACRPQGQKVGSPEWAHTAAVYMRGWLQDEAGVKLPDIHWHQAGINEPGRTEKVELNLPKASSSPVSTIIA